MSPASDRNSPLEINHLLQMCADLSLSGDRSCPKSIAQKNNNEITH